MFGWFKKTQSTEPTEPLRSGPDNAGMAADLDQYITDFLAPYREFMLKKLDEMLSECVSSSEGSPILLARDSYAVFAQTVEDFKGELQTKVMAALQGWLEVEKDSGLQPDLAKVVEARLQTFCGDLQLEGLRVLSDRADILKELDDKWRSQNPELAIQFPLD